MSTSLEELRELKSELRQVTYEYNAVGKVVINKAPAGHASPNRADSVMIAFAPVSAGMSIMRSDEPVLKQDKQMAPEVEEFDGDETIICALEPGESRQVRRRSLGNIGPRDAVD